MNADQLPPFRLAQLLRQLANAREQNHPIAVDIDAALWFEHLRNGNLCCDFSPMPGMSPCIADGFVALSNETKDHDRIFICCLEHLPTSTTQASPAPPPSPATTHCYDTTPSPSRPPNDNCAKPRRTTDPSHVRSTPSKPTSNAASHPAETQPGPPHSPTHRRPLK